MVKLPPKNPRIFFVSRFNKNKRAEIELDPKNQYKINSNNILQAMGAQNDYTTTKYDCEGTIGDSQTFNLPLIQPIQQEDLAIQQGELEIQQEDLEIQQEDLAIQQEDLAIQQGELEIQQEELEIQPEVPTFLPQREEDPMFMFENLIPMEVANESRQLQFTDLSSFHSGDDGDSNLNIFNFEFYLFIIPCYQFNYI